jgi:hypothetical protein
MPTKEHEKPAANDGAAAKQQRSEQIGRQILRDLGLPTDLRAVHVRPLWENRYRANVLVGPDVSAMKIAHSYFLEADGEGTIVSSSPPIKKVYGSEKKKPA